jgi:hypothetical protein
MPRFTQEKIADPKKSAKAIPDEVIDQYVEYIQNLEKGNEGILEFDEGEDVIQARKALVEAGVRCKKYVRVRKPRGDRITLRFRSISKAEYDESRSKAMARGAKIRAARARK